MHPTERAWGLAATWRDCNSEEGLDCDIYKEVYLTKDLGQSWSFIEDYVYDFEWAYSKYMEENGVTAAPKERIFVVAQS